eukprot:Seg649.15 transcript_id=Seg649.15/GoldUCD/mRNA.D3Y31 product="hypothetical protein" protein_id=Seg649.15/GoldUCD/D3Y31
MLYILIQDEFVYHNRDLQDIKMYGADQNDTENTKHEKTNAKRGITSGKTPLIFFHTRRLHTPLVYDADCEVTRDPARFDESHAVVFHAKDLPLPRSITERRRNRDQAWVYFNLESPKNTRKVKQNEMLFNLTITPIRESDIVHPYGYFTQIEEETPIDLDVPDKDALVAWNYNSALNDSIHLSKLLTRAVPFDRLKKHSANSLFFFSEPPPPLKIRLIRCTTNPRSSAILVSKTSQTV